MTDFQLQWQDVADLRLMRKYSRLGEDAMVVIVVISISCFSSAILQCKGEDLKPVVTHDVLRENY